MLRNEQTEVTEDRTDTRRRTTVGADVHVSKAVRSHKDGPDREHSCSMTCQVAISFSFAVVLALPVFLTMNTVWGPSFSHMICALL